LFSDLPVGAQPAPDPNLTVALSPNLRGSLFMAIAMASFTMNDAITKAVSSDINFGEIMLVRGLFAIVLIAALTISRRAIRPVRTLMVKPVALRVMGEVGGTVAFLAAIVHLPLANISAIMQALPLAITLGAAVVLSEPVGWRRWTAIGIGFAGVLVIVRPGLAGFNQFALLALISVLFCTLRDLATNRIPAEIPSLFITLLTTIVVTVVGALVLVPLGGWVTPSARVVGLLALAAVFVLTGYQCVIMAMRAGDISAVAPFRYTALLWAILLGYVLFNEVPDIPMIVGASMIVASGLYAFYRERVRARTRPAANASSLPPDGL
jgi:drug/metabolite transporter (DMT)-like permease